MCHARSSAKDLALALPALACLSCAGLRLAIHELTYGRKDALLRASPLCTLRMPHHPTAQASCGSVPGGCPCTHRSA